MPDPKPPVRGGKRLGGIPVVWWIVGGVGAAGIVYFAYRRSASSSAPADGGATDSSGIDPTTGVPYTDEEAAYAQESTTGGYGDTGYSGVVGSGGGGNTQVAVTVKTPRARTNREWLVEGEKAVNHKGFTRGATIAALSAYLIGAPITQHQLNIVETVVHHIGPPPEHVPNPHVLPHHSSQPKPKRKSTAVKL